MPKILSLKDESTFRFSNLPVAGLCNCSTYSEERLFSETTSELTPVLLWLREDYLSKHVETIEATLDF